MMRARDRQRKLEIKKGVFFFLWVCELFFAVVVLVLVVFKGV